MIEREQAPAIETRTAVARLRDDGIVEVTIRDAFVQSLADAEQNIAAAATAAGGRRPLLVDIRRTEPLLPEVRHYYTGPRMVAAFTALGLVVGTNAFTRILGNVYLRVAGHDIPTRLFPSPDRATAWLADYTP